MVYYNQAIGKEGGLLMDNEGLTQYTRIAISLAERIASGQLKEGDKLSGRSKLSPEYNVSPETIRRTLRLLADMKVVEVKEQSGVYVLSADNARRYLHNFADQTDIRGKQQQLKELLVRQEHLNRQMAALCRDILDETSQTPDALPNYYCRIPDDWPHSGTTVGALRFWQATGATIVDIRRGLSYIVSPGPYAELYAGDAVIFVGGVKAREAVSHFFANP